MKPQEKGLITNYFTKAVSRTDSNPNSNSFNNVAFFAKPKE